jgi:hypothetical protein
MAVKAIAEGTIKPFSIGGDEIRPMENGGSVE